MLAFCFVYCACPAPEEIVEKAEEEKDLEKVEREKKDKKKSKGKKEKRERKGDETDDSKAAKSKKKKKEEEELKKRLEERRKEEQLEKRRREQTPDYRFFYSFNLFLEDNPTTTVTTEHINEDGKVYEHQQTLCIDENILLSYYYRQFELKIFDDLNALLAKMNRFRKGQGSSPNRGQSRRKATKEDNSVDPVYVNSLFINLKPLFMGETEVSAEITTGLSRINLLEKVKVTLSLNQPIMSTFFYEKLNPLVVTVSKATEMTDEPVSFDELRERCEPAYCKYKLYDEKDYNETKGCLQDKTLHWADKRVYLTGFWEKEGLFDYLKSSEFVIELHDRDRKVDSDTKPLIFGSEEERLLPDINEVPDRKVPNNPFSNTEKKFDPYGVCHFKLDRLLDGERQLHLSANVLPCYRPDHWDIPEVDFVDQLSAGCYVAAGSELSIKLELAYPLDLTEKDPEEYGRKLTKPSYRKLIYVFEYSNTAFLRALENSISEINIEALGLTDLPSRVTNAALSTYRLSRRQRSSHHLNIITGFQVMDSNTRYFVLEGLSAGINRLWNSIQLSEEDRKTIKCLYNSEVVFPSRSYLSFDVEIKKIKLFEPLENILKEPMLYLKGAVPEDCLQGILCIQQIRDAKRLHDLVKYSILPSAEMIISVARKYGINLTKDDFYGISTEYDENDGSPMKGFMLKSLDNPVLTGNSKAGNKKKGSMWRYYQSIKPKINCYDPDYDFFIESRHAHIPDFVQTNIARFGSLKPIRNRSNIVEHPEDKQEEEVYSYSIQHLNCTMQEKERMRKEIARDKKHLYTYNPLYHTLTFSKVNVSELHKEELLASKKKWMTRRGFKTGNNKSALESNRHPNFDCLRDTVEPHDDKKKAQWGEHTATR